MSPDDLDAADDMSEDRPGEQEIQSDADPDTESGQAQDEDEPAKVTGAHRPPLPFT
jgi:hypothetical protein